MDTLLRIKHYFVVLSMCITATEALCIVVGSSSRLATQIGETDLMKFGIDMLVGTAMFCTVGALMIMWKRELEHEQEKKKSL
jgi:hypothetical protein